MKIYTVIRKGELHPVFCEDFFISQEINQKYYLAAVMDGCSSGRDAHFSSALIGKILLKISHILVYDDTRPLEKGTRDLAKLILQSLFKELKEARNHLMLDTLELLSTLIMMLYNDDTQEAFVISIGDGFVMINGEIHEIDQDNRPDYLAYHLGEDFEEWYAHQQHIFFVDRPEEIALSTDGVDTFQGLRPRLPEGFKVLDYLLLDREFEQNANMLGKKCNILETKYGLLPADDVSVIRIRF